MKIFIAITLHILIALLIQNKYRGSILFTGLASIYVILDLINYDGLEKGLTNNSLLTLILLLIA
ncbi:SLC13 family permease, partial [Aliarcobacter butzleri]